MSSIAAQTVKRILLEATQLSKSAFVARPTTVIEARQLLQKAVASNESSTLAMTLLRLDKEIVYMKYEGMGAYINKRMCVKNMLNFNFSSIAEDSSTRMGSAGKNDTASVPGTNANRNEKVAKVAFMITKMQKQTLQHMYMYSEKHVKALKPIEALLIIEHKIYADDESKWRAQLDQLVKQNEQLETETHQQKQADTNQVQDVGARIEVEKEEINESRYVKELGLGFEQNNEPQEDHMKEQDMLANALVTVPEIGIEQKQEPSSLIKPFTSGSETSHDEDGESAWYEVIEVTNGSPVVTALYKTKQEAQECLDIKLDLMNKRAKSSASGSRETVEYLVSKRMENQA
mmetsp:Transcript_19531/g.28522  ORF Transcript_19531/g.28522 Transcript_19531/m.28522 type:complete len:346 (+) Transcript_19531:100-1137(+)